MTNTELLDQFDITMQKLLQLLSLLSDEQLNTVPFEDSWTAGQVGDHLYKSYDVIGILRGNTEPTERPAGQKLDGIRKMLLDFTTKLDAPPETLPTHDPIHTQALLAALPERIAQQREVLLHDDLSPVCLDFAIPGAGHFTRLEWLGYNTLHTQRHIYQLKNSISTIK